MVVFCFIQEELIFVGVSRLFRISFGPDQTCVSSGIGDVVHRFLPDAVFGRENMLEGRYFPCRDEGEILLASRIDSDAPVIRLMNSGATLFVAFSPLRCWKKSVILPVLFNGGRAFFS